MKKYEQIKQEVLNEKLEILRSKLKRLTELQAKHGVSISEKDIEEIKRGIAYYEKIISNPEAEDVKEDVEKIVKEEVKKSVNDLILVVGAVFKNSDGEYGKYGGNLKGFFDSVKSPTLRELCTKLGIDSQELEECFKFEPNFNPTSFINYGDQLRKYVGTELGFSEQELKTGRKH